MLSQDTVLTELARGGPIVLSLVLIGGLTWRAGYPLLIRFIGVVEALNENLKDMTRELSNTNTEIRLMAARVDMLEREVSRISPETLARSERALSAPPPILDPKPR